MISVNDVQRKRVIFDYTTGKNQSVQKETLLSPYDWVVWYFYASKFYIYLLNIAKSLCHIRVYDKQN